MMSHDNISDELLNSFIDNELESDEQNKLFAAMEQDEKLKARACQLHGLKKILQHAYSLPAAPLSRLTKKPRLWPGTAMQCLAAAVLLLLFGGSSGWLISSNALFNSHVKISRLIKTIQNDNVAQEPDKIIVQVSSGNPVRLKAALDETENLLQTYKHNNQPLKMEILANGSGLNLLRIGISPFGPRVEQMSAKYPNLQFFACAQTIAALQDKGVYVRLMPDTRLATSALDEINKRVHQGWDYVRT